MTLGQTPSVAITDESARVSAGFPLTDLMVFTNDYR